MGRAGRSRDGKARPGFEGKVFYVWFDAPIEYIACTEEWAAANPAPKNKCHGGGSDKGAGDVRYVQFMGKDNVAFHTVSFPVTILGSKEPWKTVDTLEVVQLAHLVWRQVFDERKARHFHGSGAGDFAGGLLALASDGERAGSRTMPPSPGSISRGVVNKDLADVLGNFVNRITRFCASKFGEAVPAAGQYGETEAKLIADLDTKIAAYTAALEAMEFRKAFAELRGIWVAGNEYLQIAAPWTAFKTDPDRAAAGVRAGLNLIVLFAALSAPVIPETAEKMFAVFGLDPKEAGKWPTSAKAALSNF